MHTADDAVRPVQGESVPRVKKVGDRVIGGTLVVEGTIHVRVTSVAEDTVLQQIIKLVEDAQTAKPQLQVR
jgi:Cu+-exporting ATPase